MSAEAVMKFYETCLVVLATTVTVIALVAAGEKLAPVFMRLAIALVGGLTKALGSLSSNSES